MTGRPGRETGARIETVPQSIPTLRISVAPVARPGRGLKPDRKRCKSLGIGRPGRETGARIETISLTIILWKPRRPGHETGARIETFYSSNGIAANNVAPVARPGRGLKLRQCD